MPRVLGGSYGDGYFLMGQVPLYFTEWIAILLAVMDTLDFMQAATPYLKLLEIPQLKFLMSEELMYVVNKDPIRSCYDTDAVGSAAQQKGNKLSDFRLKWPGCQGGEACERDDGCDGQAGFHAGCDPVSIF